VKIYGDIRTTKARLKTRQ